MSISLLASIPQYHSTSSFPTSSQVVCEKRKERSQSVPSSALLDLGKIQLQQIIEPRQQFLSRKSIVMVSKITHTTTTDIWQRWLSSPHLDSPMVVVVMVVFGGVKRSRTPFFAR